MSDECDTCGGTGIAPVLYNAREPCKDCSDYLDSEDIDELTALCPFDFGGPDFYNLLIKYRASTECVESKSLKEYLEGYRQQEITAEELAVEIYAMVVNASDPEQCYVRLEQARRGGIEETVEVGDVDLA